MLISQLPHEFLTPLQAAVGVVQKVLLPARTLTFVPIPVRLTFFYGGYLFQGLRPTIPRNTDPRLTELLERCWRQNPNERPDFSEILEILQQISREVGCR